MTLPGGLGYRRNEETGVPRKSIGFNLEHALRELEALVARMEVGDLGLEESLKHFERGIALTRGCQKALCEAEQRIRVLLDKDGKGALAPFEAGREEEALGSGPAEP